MFFNLLLSWTLHTGISCLHSFINSKDIAKFIGWMERPFDPDIKKMFCQKSYLTREKLMFVYFLKLNIISLMDICPYESKKLIIKLCFLLKTRNFISFF